MGGRSARVTITEKQQQILLEFSKSRTEPLAIVGAAQLLYHLDGEDWGGADAANVGGAGAIREEAC